MTRRERVCIAVGVAAGALLGALFGLLGPMAAACALAIGGGAAGYVLGEEGKP